jgi:hypothetical protein
MNKKDREQLLKWFLKAMKNLGAAQEMTLGPSCRWPCRWQLQTELGLLRLSFREETGTIFCRFQNPGRASEVLNPNKDSGPVRNYNRLNPYSGKWNFHFGKTSAKEAWTEFWSELQPILLEE